MIDDALTEEVVVTRRRACSTIRLPIVSLSLLLALLISEPMIEDDRIGVLMDACMHVSYLIKKARGMLL